MTTSRTIAATLCAAMLLTGCSTRPRNFSANLSAPVADRSAYETNFRTCQMLVRAGHTGGFKATAATALATGVGTIGTGMAMAASGMVGITSSGAGAAAAGFAMPVVGILAGFGVSRMIRGGKERKYKRAMTTCLVEYGYTVEGWDRVHKRDDAARIAAERASVAAPALVQPTLALAAEPGA